MFEYTCTKCDCHYTTEIPMDADVRKICFSCAMDELECCDNPNNLIEIENAQADHGQAGIYLKFYCKECKDTWYYYDHEFEQLVEQYEKENDRNERK